MTIADGGGVTFPQAATFTSGLQSMVQSRLVLMTLVMMLSFLELPLVRMPCLMKVKTGFI